MSDCGMDDQPILEDDRATQSPLRYLVEKTVKSLQSLVIRLTRNNPENAGSAGTSTTDDGWNDEPSISGAVLHIPTIVVSIPPARNMKLPNNNIKPLQNPVIPEFSDCSANPEGVACEKPLQQDDVENGCEPRPPSVSNASNYSTMLGERRRTISDLHQLLIRNREIKFLMENQLKTQMSKLDDMKNDETISKNQLQQQRKWVKATNDELRQQCNKVKSLEKQLQSKTDEADRWYQAEVRKWEEEMK